MARIFPWVFAKTALAYEGSRQAKLAREYERRVKAEQARRDWEVQEDQMQTSAQLRDIRGAAEGRAAEQHPEIMAGYDRAAEMHGPALRSATAGAESAEATARMHGIDEEGYRARVELKDAIDAEELVVTQYDADIAALKYKQAQAYDDEVFQKSLQDEIDELEHKKTERVQAGELHKANLANLEARTQAARRSNRGGGYKPSEFQWFMQLPEDQKAKVLEDRQAWNASGRAPEDEGDQGEVAYADSYLRALGEAPAGLFPLIWPMVEKNTGPLYNEIRQVVIMDRKTDKYVTEADVDELYKWARQLDPDSSWTRNKIRRRLGLTPKQDTG